MTQLPPWTRHQFEQYVQIATAKMAQEGVLKAGDGVRPHSFQSLAVRTDQGGWSIGMTVDLSPIDMPRATSMSASTQPNGSVSWSFGRTLIRAIPGEWTPEEGGEGLSEHVLRKAYRSFLEPSRADSRGR